MGKFNICREVLGNDRYMQAIRNSEEISYLMLENGYDTCAITGKYFNIYDNAFLTSGQSSNGISISFKAINEAYKYRSKYKIDLVQESIDQYRKGIEVEQWSDESLNEFKRDNLKTFNCGKYNFKIERND